MAIQELNKSKEGMIQDEKERTCAVPHEFGQCHVKTLQCSLDTCILVAHVLSCFIPPWTTQLCYHRGKGWEVFFNGASSCSIENHLPFPSAHSSNHREELAQSHWDRVPLNAELRGGLSFGAYSHMPAVPNG